MAESELTDMVVTALLLVLIASRLLGGKFKNLLAVKLRGVGWLGPVIGGQLAGILVVRSVAPWLAGILLVTAYIALLAIVWLNRRLPGMLLVLCGIFLNFLVITANGGVMPTTPAALEQIGRTSKLEVAPSNSAGDGATIAVTHSKDGIPSEPQLLILGDVIVVPLPDQFASVVSIGDLLIGLGLSWFGWEAMRMVSKVGDVENEANTIIKSKDNGTSGNQYFNPAS